MSVFVFALDGASPDLVNKWINEGYLPNLKRLRDSGVNGTLESTFPPLTGPAWSTFQTGVNPGKHGIYNWLNIAEDYRGNVINRSGIQSPTLWELISSEGGKVGALSVPVTYPPQEVNGFVVPGFLTPTDSNASSYPPGLAEELLEAVPEYKYLPEPYMTGKTSEGWVNELKTAVEARGAAARFLYDRYFDGRSDELFVTHFFATDLVQHFLWDEVTSDHDPRLEVFKHVDKEIGRMMDLAPRDALFLAISDHGFGQIRRTFNINNWLHKHGYLHFSSNFTGRVKRLLHRLKFTQQTMKPLGELIYPLASSLNIVENSITGLSTNDYLNSLFLSPEDVDWEKTVAYSRSDIGHIRINQEGRDPRGVVSPESSDYYSLREELMEGLSELTVPSTDQSLFEWVKPKEDIYHGSYLRQAPDILFNPLQTGTCGYGAVMFLSSDIFSPPLHPGHHRRNGILLGAGSDVETGQVNASLKDIAPTILHSLDFPIPEHMDGEVISEICPGTPTFQSLGSRQSTFVEESSEESRSRLESLGYL